MYYLVNIIIASSKFGGLSISWDGADGEFECEYKFHFTFLEDDGDG